MENFTLDWIFLHNQRLWWLWQVWSMLLTHWISPNFDPTQTPLKKNSIFQTHVFWNIVWNIAFLVEAVFVGSATTKIGVFLSQKGPNGFVCLLFVSPCNTVFHKSEYLDENFLWRAGGVYTRSELSVGEYASISRHCRPPINDPWKITPD